MPTKKGLQGGDDKAPRVPVSTEPTPEPESEPSPNLFGPGPTPGASSAPGGNTDNVYLRVGTEPRKVDTSLAGGVPDGVKVGKFVGLDPNTPNAPASHTSMPLVPTEE